jgi:hypothetical protein
MVDFSPRRLDPESAEVQSVYARARGLHNLWTMSGRMKYTLPADQLPYLTAISLHDVTVANLQLPCECVRFETPEMAAFVMVAPEGIALRFDEGVGEGKLMTVWADRIINRDVTFDAWIESMAAKMRAAVGIDDARIQAALEGQKEMLTAIITALFVKEIHPDYFSIEILAKDRAAYDEARRKGDQGRIDTIEQRAIRRRKGEHHIFHTGSSWICDVENPDEPIRHTHTGGGTEHSHRYIVKGHFRRQRFGPRWSQMYYRLIARQIRRRDLKAQE